MKTVLFEKKLCRYVKIMKEMYHLTTWYWIKSTSMYLKILHAFVSVWYQHLNKFVSVFISLHVELG